MRSGKISFFFFTTLVFALIIFDPGPAKAQFGNFKFEASGSPQKKYEAVSIELEKAYLNPAGASTNECAFVINITFGEQFREEMKLRKVSDILFFSLSIDNKKINAILFPPYRKDIKISRNIKKYGFAGIIKTTGPERFTAEVSVYKKETWGLIEEKSRTSLALELSPEKAFCGEDEFHRRRRVYFNSVSNFVLSSLDLTDNSALNYFIVKYAFYISKLYNAKFEVPQYFDAFINAIQRMRPGANFNYTFALISGSIAIMDSMQLESMKGISRNLEYMKEYCAGDKKSLAIHDKVFYYDEKNQLYVDSAFWGGEKINEIPVYGPSELAAQSPFILKYVEKLADIAPESSKASGNLAANYSARGFKKMYPDALIVDETPGEKKCIILSFSNVENLRIKDHRDFIADSKNSISSNVKAAYIKIKGLSAPSIKSHDYKKMEAELGRKSSEIEIFASSAFTPREASFIYFSSVGDALDLFDGMKKHAARIVEIFPVSQNFDKVKHKIERQLLIKVNPLLRPLYGLAVSDLTIILDDLYVAEGTALALSFNVLQKIPFNISRERNKKEILAENPGIKVCEGSETHLDTIIDFSVSGAREISSYSCYLGDRFVVSNNLNFLKKLIRCHAEKKGSLSFEDDFRYMRALYLEKKPSGFVYFGEAAIRRMISPEFKINEARRVNCLDCLDGLESSLCLYRLIQNDPLASAEIPELINRGALLTIPVCPSGGHFALDAARSSFFCDVHGYRPAPTPLSDISVNFITEAEELEYKNFAKLYNSYFTRYFDPVGIEITNDIYKTTFKTYILPLIENSQYDELRRFAGGKPFKSSFAGLICGETIFLLGLKIRMFHEYKSDLSHIEDSTLRNDMARRKASLVKDLGWRYPQDIFSWIGPDLNLIINDFGPEHLLNNYAETPIAVVNNIKNKDTCLLYLFSNIKHYLNGYKDFEEDRYGKNSNEKRPPAGIFNSFRHFGDSLKEVRSAFREVEYLLSKASIYKDYVILKESCFFFNLHFAVSNNYLIVSPNLDTIRSLIDGQADEKAAAKARAYLEPAILSHPPEHNVIALLNFRAALRAPEAAAEYFEKDQINKCLEKLSAINKVKFAEKIFPGVISNVPDTLDISTRLCPDLIEYSRDGDTGFYSCPLHGEAFMGGREGRKSYDRYHLANQDITKERKTAAKKTLKTLLGLLTSVSASLTFTPEGIYTVLTLQK